MNLKERIETFKTLIHTQEQMLSLYKNPKMLIKDIEYHKEILSYLEELQQFKESIKK